MFRELTESRKNCQYGLCNFLGLKNLNQYNNKNYHYKCCYYIHVNTAGLLFYYHKTISPLSVKIKPYGISAFKQGLFPL